MDLAGRRDDRLYRYALAGLATVADAAPEAGGPALALAPNPARGSARLGVTLAEAGEVRVTLADVLGRAVLALDRTLGAGPQTLPLDLSGLSPGVYVARVVTATGAATQTLTVAR